MKMPNWETNNNEENKKNLTKIKETPDITIPDNITTKTSEATRRRTLFKKYKKLFKSKEALSDFQEPILFLERQSSKVEFYENATGGKFEYKHSDGKDRFIILDTRFLKSFDYAGRTFKGYYCHEDFPTPLPDSPIITAELVAIMFEKVLNDISKWKTEELKAKALNIKAWAIFAGVIIGGILLYVILAPSNPQTAQTLLENMTNATQNITNVTTTAITIIG